MLARAQSGAILHSAGAGAITGHGGIWGERVRGKRVVADRHQTEL